MTSPDLCAGAALLARLRVSGETTPLLPDACAPRTLAEAYRLRAALAELLGSRIAAWKVAAPPGQRPFCAPILAADIRTSPADWMTRTPLGVEAEIGFRLACDLPGRSDGRPYERMEVAEAVESAFAAIELVGGRLTDFAAAPRLHAQADGLANTGLILGELLPGWRQTDLTALCVSLAVGGEIRVQRRGGNPAPDLLGTVLWLANHLPALTGGLRAGDVVITGSFTGLERAAPGQSVVARFADVCQVVVTFKEAVSE